MSYAVQTAFPSQEPITLTDLKNFAKVFVTTDDDLISDNIVGAREYIENITGLYLANRSFIQTEDGLPSIPFGFSGYAYSASQNAYFGYGPLTPYPPMGWQPRINPFEIQLVVNPVTSVQKIVYVDTNGHEQTLHPTVDFTVDITCIPCRLAPLPGQRWPQGMIAPGNVRIYFTAGYTNGEQDIQIDQDSNVANPPDVITDPITITTGIPAVLKTAIRQLAHHWYVNRDVVANGVTKPIPHALDNILKSFRILSLQPWNRY